MRIHLVPRGSKPPKSLVSPKGGLHDEVGRIMKLDLNLPASTAEFFKHYAAGIPNWQTDRPQPEVIRLLDEGRIEGPVLDLGCGAGDNAMEIARRGLRVLGMDPVPEALRRAREKVRQSSLAQPPEFMVGDALQLEESGLEFETILDSAVFHIFSDADQLAYVRGVESVLSSGGRLHLLSFSELEIREPGPRRLSLEQIRAPFGGGWEMEEARRCRYEDRSKPDGAHAWRVSFRRC